MIYTKRQHTRNIANVQADIARLNRIIDATNVAYDAIMLRDNDDVHPFIMEYLERKFNESHDLRWTLEHQIDALEMRFRHRNWTASDYYMSSLVAQNID